MRYTGPSKAVLALVDARDDKLCLRCADGTPAADYQHRIGRGSGGTRRTDVNGVAAIVSLCRACHSWCERHEREAAYATGWAIRRSDSRAPSQIPLVDLRGVEFLLTDEGQLVYTQPLSGFWPADPHSYVTPWRAL